MSRTTRATQALTKLKIAFETVTYDYDPGAARIGLQAAEAIDEPPHRVYKTLMAELIVISISTVASAAYKFA